MTTWRQIGSAAGEATPLLLEALEYDCDWRCYEIVDTLGAIGETAQAAIPKLLELLQQNASSQDKP